MTNDRIGLGLGGDLTADEMVECITLAESLGYQSAWIAEGHGGDQFALLAACAVKTSRIQLGTSISSVFVRSVPTIAMAAATIDQLSGHRFILGLGSSHRVQVEPEHGIGYTKPIQRVRETVDVIRTLLRDGKITDYQGETIRIERFDFWFKPSRPEVPIYLAGLFPKMLEVCGEIGQGLILTRTSLESCAQVIEHVEVGAHRAGRGLDDIDITTLLRRRYSSGGARTAASRRRFLRRFLSPLQPTDRGKRLSHCRPPDPRGLSTFGHASGRAGGPR